jgi:hypothetical protein
MTSFNGVYIVVTITISFTLFLKTSMCSKIPQPPSEGPSNNINYAPRPLTSYENYLDNCESKVKSVECGEQIFFSVLIGNQIVSDYCCQSLVDDIGKSCHFTMIRYAIKLPGFKKKKTEILKRSEKVWNDCLAIRSILS